MKKIIYLSIFVFFTSLTSAQNKDNSKLGITDLAICTAAAMKSGYGIQTFTDWSETLEKRYHSIYPNLNAKELDLYTSERIKDKLNYLKRNGILTSFKFKEFYDNNCKSFYPK